jgi:ribosomal protein L2
MGWKVHEHDSVGGFQTHLDRRVVVPVDHPPGGRRRARAARPRIAPWAAHSTGRRSRRRPCA